MALNTFAKLNDQEFVNAVRTSALNIRDTAQAKLAQAEHDGRAVLAERVLVSAQYTNQFSQFLTDLAGKIAPAPKAKPRKAAAKPAAKKAAPKAAPKAAAKPAAKRTVAKKAAPVAAAA